MKLYIDTSSSKEITVGLDGIRHHKKVDKGSQELLSLIDKMLNKAGKTLSDITEIQFNRGPGSFTGLRVGASVANTLGWVLKIPVNRRNIGTGGLEGLGGVMEPLY